jgi:hypothetical protein
MFHLSAMVLDSICVIQDTSGNVHEDPMPMTLCHTVGPIMMVTFSNTTWEVGTLGHIGD